MNKIESPKVCFYCEETLLETFHTMKLTLKNPKDSAQNKDELDESDYIENSKKEVIIHCCRKCREDLPKAEKLTGYGCGLSILSMFLSGIFFVFTDFDLGLGESEFIYPFLAILIGITVYYATTGALISKAKISGKKNTGIYSKHYLSHPEVKLLNDWDIIKQEWIS